MGLYSSLLLPHFCPKPPFLPHGKRVIILAGKVCVIDQIRKHRPQERFCLHLTRASSWGGAAGAVRFAFKVGVAPSPCGAVGGQDNRARNETGPSIILHFTRGATLQWPWRVPSVWAREFVFQFVCGETGSMSSRIGRGPTTRSAMPINCPLELKQ